jgi:glycosyltransferase involved in cell wall biosynthesis
LAKLKILLLTSEYPPYLRGGVGSFSYELSRGLARVGNEVIVVTRGIGLNHLANINNIRIYYLMSPDLPPRDLWFYFTGMKEFKRIIETEKLDVIHDVSGALSYNTWLSRSAPTILTIHGSPTLDIIRLGLGGEDRIRSLLFSVSHALPSRLMGFISKPVFGRLVFVSKYALWSSLNRVRDEGMRSRLYKISRVVYNGVDVSKLRDVASRAVCDDYSIAFISRLMEYKGVKWLIKAFRVVARELPKARLHIVGGGPLYRDVRELVARLGLENNVAIHGSLPRNNALNILAKSKILVHPSLVEGFGIVIAEAYAMGKPVIAHRSGYAYELVAETGAGLMVNTLDEEEFSSAMITLLTDDNLYRKLSQKALDASKRFNIEEMVRGYLRVYGELT